MKRLVEKKLVSRRAGDIANSSYAKEIFGWEATKTLEDMCKDSWHWQSNNPVGYNLILCGTRLWPISRTAMPKQFVKLFNNKSLFQLTTERNNILCDKQCIVTSYEQYFWPTRRNKNNVYLLEPIPRNTAPAIALACMSFDKEELVLVTPSDHLIKDEEVILKAQELAKEGNIVTFPETGFGYIESENVFNVKAHFWNS